MRGKSSMNLWLLKSETKLLAGEAHGGGVDDGHQLLRVFGQELVEQLLISLKQLNLAGNGGINRTKVWGIPAPMNNIFLRSKKTKNCKDAMKLCLTIYMY